MRPSTVGCHFTARPIPVKVAGFTRMGLMNTSLSRRAALAALSSGFLQLAGCGGSQHGDPAAAPVAPVPVAPAPPPPPPVPISSRTFAYVANSAAGKVSIFEVAESGGLRAVGEVAAAGNVLSITVHPSGRFAYAVNAGAGSVSAYTVDPTTGMLSPNGDFATGLQPQQMRIHPSGRYAYLGHSAETFLMFHTVADDGRLIDPSVVDVGTSPTGLTFDPSGEHLYVESDSRVATYIVEADGGLSPLSSIGTIGSAVDVAIAPSGLAAYVVSTNGAVFVHPVDPSGALNTGTQVAAGGTSHALAIDPAGQFAYVANFGEHTISMYAIDASDGNLLPTTPATVATGTQPGGVALSPNGRFAYVTSQAGNAVHVFTVDRGNGVLTPFGDPVPAGNGAFGITIASFPRP